MSESGWQQVPVGLNAQRWVTRTDCRTVLAIAHTVTTGQRLMDAIRLVEDDLRVQVVFTMAPDPFNNGVEDFLRGLDGVTIPWAQAVSMPFDLALAAALGHGHEVHAPLAVMPHGAGYNKLIIGRGRAVGAAVAYDLDSQRLVNDGTVVPSAIALPHDDERARLARSCPEALPVAETVGDPVYDRLTVSLPMRRFYRRALGLAPGQRLVVVTSTWGPKSLLGRRPDVLRGLVAELPRDEYRVLALIHPNAWYGHGMWQWRTWLAGCLREGLTLLPPQADWRGALVAADWVVGDHGSATLYGAAVEVPVLLAYFPAGEVDPGSAAARLAEVAPPLVEGCSFADQLRQAAAGFEPGRYGPVVARISSQPGRFNVNMRRMMYRLLRLSMPASIPRTEPVSPAFLERAS